MGSNKIREGVTKLSLCGKILDIKIWGGRTNLNHTTPRSQSRWVEARSHGGVTASLPRRSSDTQSLFNSHGYTQAHIMLFG